MTGRTKIFPENGYGDTQKILAWIKNGQFRTFRERELQRSLLWNGDRLQTALEILESMGVISERVYVKSGGKSNNPKRVRQVLIDLEEIVLPEFEKIRPVIKKLMTLEQVKSRRQAAIKWGIHPATFYRWIDPTQTLKDISEKQFEPLLVICDKWQISRKVFLKEMAKVF